MFGTCLPATCQIDRFESAVNDLIRTNDNNTIVKIPKETCQFEESDTDWTPIDFVAM